MLVERFKKLNKKVCRHEGNAEDWLYRHREACNLAHRIGNSGIEIVGKSLFRRATDDRGLILAWTHVLDQSGETPGPGDRILMKEYLTFEMFEYCRGLRDHLREGEYECGPVRAQHISKYGGGSRTIQIANYVDRVVACAAFQVLDPLIDPLLNDDCFGCRRGRSRFHALVRLEKLACEGHQFLVVDDIRKAFDNVPRKPLFEILYSIVKNEMFVDHVSRVLGMPQEIGIPQGNAMSPLLLNLYAHHCIDRPWRRRFPACPLLRYVDDLLVVTRTLNEAIEARAYLDRIVTSAQLSLKGSGNDSIVNLAHGESLEWLGHQIEFQDGRMIITLRHDELPRLVFKLEQGEYRRKKPNDAILQWIRSRGPAYANENHRDTIDMIYEAAEIAGPHLTVTPKQIMQAWRWGHRQWQQLRTNLLSATEFE